MKKIFGIILTVLFVVSISMSSFAAITHSKKETVEKYDRIIGWVVSLDVVAKTIVVKEEKSGASRTVKISAKEVSGLKIGEKVRIKLKAGTDESVGVWVLRGVPKVLPVVSSPDQKISIKKLQADVADIKSGSLVTQAQIDALANDLNSMAWGVPKLSRDSVNELSEALTTAIARGNISSTDKAKLMQDVGAVMNSAHMSNAKLNQAMVNAQKIMNTSGIPQGDAQQVAQDLQAIVTEVK